MSKSSKRSHPLGYAEGAGSRAPAGKVLKQDTATIYEATLNKLRLGSRAATTTGRVPGGCASPNAEVWGKRHDSDSGSSSCRISNGVMDCCQNGQDLMSGVLGQHGFGGGSKNCNGSSALENCQNEQNSVRVPANSPLVLAWGMSTNSTHSTSTVTSQLGSSQNSFVGGPLPCYVCRSRAADYMCFHCSRGCCEHCRRCCEGCQELFCSFCSTFNYDERNDRSFCFDCNAVALEKHSHLPIQSTSNDDALDMEYC